MIRLLSGDCRDVLPTLPAESVQCVVTSPPYYALRSYLDAAHPDKHREIGSESTPDEYLATMVGVFREVRRVLRRDGTCWVNMGDSFSGGNNAGWRPGNPEKNGGASNRDGVGNVPGLAAKQLLLMPARLALALQADGWWVRSAIVWAKPNPMPESVTDRPTSAYEMVYLLTKSARYFYDADAVRSPLADKTFTTFGTKHRSQGNDAGGNVKSDNWGSSLDERKPKLNGAGEIAGAACRNVWTIATHAYSAAHFATFPPELAERCIKAGTSEKGCCPQCGAPWYRVTNKGDIVPKDGWVAAASGRDALSDGSNQASNRLRDGHVPGSRDIATIGWHPTCACDMPGPVVPCTVLDPFAGAGTTLLVADRLQRDAIGIELNTAYTEMAMERCRQDAPLFTSFPPAEDPEDERMADLFTDMAAD